MAIFIVVLCTLILVSIFAIVFWLEAHHSVEQDTIIKE